mmetsp:Transcript_12949/g.45523  ORF Transcript_12949/g.45523 Transcript_12949/m.45523 type:complete len:134 (+) Transcript_12949:211-612(+)
MEGCTQDGTQERNSRMFVFKHGKRDVRTGGRVQKQQAKTKERRAEFRCRLYSMIDVCEFLESVMLFWFFWAAVYHSNAEFCIFYKFGCRIIPSTSGGHGVHGICVGTSVCGVMVFCKLNRRLLQVLGGFERLM